MHFDVVSGISHQNALEHLQGEIDRLSAMLENYSTDDGLMAAAKKTARRLEMIQTPAQLYSFLTVMEQSVLNSHRRRQIRVQPASISRRKAGSMTSGSARHRSGRPLQFADTCKRRAVKRLRSLSAAVRSNRANAKRGALKMREWKMQER